MICGVQKLEQCGVKECVFVSLHGVVRVHCLGPGDSDLQVGLLIATIYEEKITADSPPLQFPKNDLLIW